MFNSVAKIIAKITNTVDFIDDFAIEGGSSVDSIYNKKSINLQNSSQALDIRVVPSVRSESINKMFLQNIWW